MKTEPMKTSTRSLSAVMVMALVCGASGALAQAPHSHHHSFSDAEKWSAVFDDPARDAWQKPHEVIRSLALKPDAAVADLGAGTGYFSLRLAHVVPQGRVYAVDIEPAMVKHLADRARTLGLANVFAIEGAADTANLPAKVDLVLLVDVYHHIDAREAYFARLRASLKPGGRVAVIDFNASSPVGPPRSARISAERVRAEMHKAGYAFERAHDFLPNQYYLVFSASGR